MYISVKFNVFVTKIAEDFVKYRLIVSVDCNVSATSDSSVLTATRVIAL